MLRRSLPMLSLLSLVLLGSACQRDVAQHKAAGNVYFREGDVEGALREYHAAVRLAPGDANARTLLGNAYYEKGDFAAARTAYGHALDRDPTGRAALQGLATIEIL